VKDKDSGEWGPSRSTARTRQHRLSNRRPAILHRHSHDERRGRAPPHRPELEFGGEARGTAGDKAVVPARIFSNVERPVLVYSEREGLFGGAALKGGALSPDEEANRVYYGEPISVKQILFEKKVKPTDPAKKLGQILSKKS